jgi:ATP-dependent helicase/nuclease subunit A
VCSLPGVQRPAKSASGGQGGVWRDSLTEPRAEPEQALRAAEALQVAQAVAELTGPIGLQPGEVMVLARKRATLALVADALAALGVPHVVAEPLALDVAPESLDLVALLDVLASPGHDLSLARALKSPIFGAGDDDLLCLSKAARRAGSWRAALLGTDALPSPSLRRARALMEGWLAVAERLPPHDLLDRIVHESDLLARLAAAVPAARRPAALQAVQALLAAALSAQGGRFISLYAFVRAVRAGRVKANAGAPAAAVHLLTVHGAKGLEARAVVLADTDPERRPAERALLLVDWTVDEPAPARVAFVRDEARLAPSLRDLWQREAAAAQREALNGLYVAMTRAKAWLVFSRTEPYARSGERSWWARAQPWCERWLLAPSAPSAPSSPSAFTPATGTIPTLPALTWQAAPQPDPLPAEVAAARLGQAIHRVLEWAGQPGLDASRWDLAEASRAAARSFGLPPGNRARVAEVASRILASPACAHFFSGPQLRWAGNEVPVAAGGQVLRIDRLVLLAEVSAARERQPGSDRTWWVLDYKLHHDPAALPAYREQLAAYAQAVRALQPADGVRAAFITARGELIVL